MLGSRLLWGEKIILNAIEREDLTEFAEWFGNLDLLIMVRDGGVFPYTLQDEEAWFEGQRNSPDVTFAIRIQQGQPATRQAKPQTADPFAPPGKLAIRSQGKETLIGSCGLFGFNWQARHAELGIAIGNPDYWGGGYGSDAVRVLLRYGFLELNLNRIYLRVYDYNTRAIAAYLKTGFVEEGRERQHMFRDGAYHDIVWMSILRDEWQDDPPPEKTA